MLIESPIQACRQELTALQIKPLLNVVASYCDLSSDAGFDGTSLRSLELEGSANLVFPASCHTQFSTDMAQAFNQLHLKRSALVQERNLKEPQCSSFPSPHLLVVDWRRSLFDGACSPITSGFINDDCIPPWDTWLGIVSLQNKNVIHGLLCWIPTALIESVNDALTIDAAQCMSWVKETQTGTTIVGWGKRC